MFDYPTEDPKPEPVSLELAIKKLLIAGEEAYGWIATYPPRKALKDAMTIARVSLDNHTNPQHDDVKIVKE